MPITEEEVLHLEDQFHTITMQKKGTAAQQAEFFLHPEPIIFVLNGTDLTMQQNYEIHQQLIDEVHVAQKNWQITQLNSNPERARAVGCVYWEGRFKDADANALKLKCFVGEDWIIQRLPSGELKFVLYINSYFYFLPDAAPIKIGK